MRILSGCVKLLTSAKFEAVSHRVVNGQNLYVSPSRIAWKDVNELSMHKKLCE